MTKQEIIAAFEQAEKDWSRPQRWWQKDRFIDRGLCRYFANKQYIYGRNTWDFLEPLWFRYRTKKGLFHFNNREERLHAIRQVLNDLKNEQ
jgi:hypothetical protein